MQPSGSSLRSEEPAEGADAMRTEMYPDSEMDKDYDLFIPNSDSDDSEYGSYFYASIDMLSVEVMVPQDPKGEIHSDAIHGFPEVYRRPGTLVTHVVFKLAFLNCPEYKYGSHCSLLSQMD